MDLSEERDLLEKALKASIGAGIIIMEIYRKGSAFAKLKKDFSPVTEADIKANDLIINYLNDTAIPVITEEGIQSDYNERKLWDRCWIVDPLDGTKEFIRKNGEFTVNVALINNGHPIAGVVYAPDSALLYFGSKSYGSFRLSGNNIPGPDGWQLDEMLSHSDQLPLEPGHNDLTIVASRSHRNRKTRQFLRGLEKEYGNINTISKGSALKFCLVAEGSADVYPRFGSTMEWDTAAGHAVALYAGCIVLRYDDGLPVVYNKESLLNPWFIVSNKLGFAAIKDIV